MSMEWIRRNYSVPAKRGGRVRFFGVEGTVTSASHYLRVRMDDGRRVLLHPTWRVEYLAAAVTDTQPQEDTMSGKYRTLTQELEELERTDPFVAEAARQLDQLPEYFARYNRHMAARAAVGKRSQRRERRDG